MNISCPPIDKGDTQKGLNFRSPSPHSIYKTQMNLRLYPIHTQEENSFKKRCQIHVVFPLIIQQFLQIFAHSTIFFFSLSNFRISISKGKFFAYVTILYK